MQTPYTSLAVFVIAYVLFVLFPNRRSAVACVGAALLMAFGGLDVRHALLNLISWNVIFLTFGTFVLAELFMQSRTPAVLAEWLIDRTRTARVAMVAVCLLSGVLSMAVENVAVVMLVAPVALSLADKLRMSPVPMLICIALSSNLQGTATLIGDPPSMILASHMRLTFNEFFVYHGRPGIFFAVQCGALASAAVVFWLFRRHRERVVLLRVEKIRSWVPPLLMAALVVGLALTSFVDRDFKWFAGTYATVLGVLGLLWAHYKARWGRMPALLRGLDWDTIFFLIGVFVLVGALSESGWLGRLAELLSAVVGQNLFLAFVLLVGVAVVVSGFVDNVPFLLAMVPVADAVARGMNAPVPLLMFGLLIGACVGGNVTPIGASANVVAIGILKKHGYTVGFGRFMGYGIPFTAAAVLAAGLFVWLVWAP